MWHVPDINPVLNHSVTKQNTQGSPSDNCKKRFGRKEEWLYQGTPCDERKKLSGRGSRSDWINHYYYYYCCCLFCSSYFSSIIRGINRSCGRCLQLRKEWNWWLSCMWDRKRFELSSMAMQWHTTFIKRIVTSQEQVYTTKITIF